MSTDIQVEIIHKETITPSSPTLPHHKVVELSFLDQFIPEVYVPLILFYPNHTDGEVDTNHQSLIAEKCGILKASLSKTLTQFYPLAGKFQYNDSFCCDDRGAAFIVARVNCRISRILENPDTEMLKCLFPAAVGSTQALTGHLLLVQINFFECGGMAIAISISHKVADAFTFSTFIKSWSAAALVPSSTTDHPVVPADFGAAAFLYPPQDFLNSPKPLVEFIQGKCITRRLVFDASRIAALKSKAASASVPNPTRVEVVSALIWKCAMEASRSNLGSIRPSLWCQAVNMRKRSGQAFTENILGNFVWRFAAMTVESEVDLQSLVTALRKSIEDFKVNYPNGLTVENAYQLIKESGNFFAREGVDNYNCTSWCWLPLYETNFGWGKPYWVSFPSLQLKNIVILMDAKDGNGIETSLTFLEEDMAKVESNKELLAYGALNPTVI
ncbi:BAHD acyltransferase At5g47980-like [Argentina anserina]|uniref:BAHD acyltransferase At5g47980-like n=1 Tax=Argentina anserina TaxID=57926 RepID=UPI0021762A3C|nr:BAHD acyltransferase At5g47980-like [Potentilla anserina]